jgi:hypothetical protein
MEMRLAGPPRRIAFPESSDMIETVPLVDSVLDELVWELMPRRGWDTARGASVGRGGVAVLPEGQTGQSEGRAGGPRVGAAPSGPMALAELPHESDRAEARLAVAVLIAGYCGRGASKSRRARRSFPPLRSGG